jgi:hypothetical protein
MYKIIGADGREYGPVTAEQLRQWIAEGRANAQTMAQAEGTTEWKPLSAFSELAETLRASVPPVGAPPPPPLGAVDAEKLAAEIIARGYRIEIGNCIRRSWELLKQHFWLVVGASALVMLAEIAVGAIPFAGGIAGMVLSAVFTGGLYWFFLRLIRGQQAVVGDAFAGFSLAFVQLMLTGIVSGVLTGLGFLLCIVPGVYLAVAWVFAPALVIDKRLEFWPAMELSRKVVTKNWWPMFGLLIVAGLLGVLGVIALCIGVLVTWPIFVGAIVFAYEDIFGAGATGQPA